MTALELTAVLNRLETMGPQRRVSDRHQRLEEARQRLLALHARGHSWRAIARELTAAGEKVSADLLRAICTGKPKHHAGKGRRSASNAEAPALQERRARSAQAAATPSGTTDGRFGARGLKP